MWTTKCWGAIWWFIQNYSVYFQMRYSDTLFTEQEVLYQIMLWFLIVELILGNVRAANSNSIKCCACREALVSKAHHCPSCYRTPKESLSFWMCLTHQVRSWYDTTHVSKMYNLFPNVRAVLGRMYGPTSWQYGLSCFGEVCTRKTGGRYSPITVRSKLGQ